MSTAPFARVVEQVTLTAQQIDELYVKAAPLSRFVLQRSDGGDTPPQFTYFGLEATPLDQSDAERLTLGSPVASDDPVAFARVPFKGGVFMYLPYEDEGKIGPQFWLVSTLLVIDHASARAFEVTIQHNGAGREAGRNSGDAINRVLRRPMPPKQVSRARDPSLDYWASDVSIEEYVSRIGEIQSRIARGELQQAILSVGLSKKTTTDANTVFEVIRRRNASPHIFLVRTEEAILVGASPAMHLRKEGKDLTVETDAGTRRVGDTEKATLAIMEELLHSAKDLEEQRMIVDETIVDLRVIAAAGEVSVPIELEVRRLGNVMHLFTVLQAQIKDGLSPVQAVLSCFPPSAVTGAPRRNAMQVIKDVERQSRGPYGGVLGLIGFDGSVDTAIILRSAWTKGDQITMRCGGGITHASVPTDEYTECMNKARAMIDCVREAETL